MRPPLIRVYEAISHFRSHLRGCFYPSSWFAVLRSANDLNEQSIAVQEMEASVRIGSVPVIQAVTLQMYLNTLVSVIF